jgi:hypothetical protein
MRVLGAFLVRILVAALIVALGLFVAQDPQVERVSFMGKSAQADLGPLVAGAVVLGFLVTLVPVLLPSRLASGIRAGAFRRRAGRLEDELTALRERYAQLEADHHRQLDEHRQLVAQSGAERPRTLPAPGAGAAMAGPDHSSRPGPITLYPPHGRAASSVDRSSSPAAQLRVQYQHLQARLQQRYHALAVRLRARYDRLAKRLRWRRDAADERTRTPHGPASPST